MKLGKVYVRLVEGEQQSEEILDVHIPCPFLCKSRLGEHALHMRFHVELLVNRLNMFGNYFRTGECDAYLVLEAAYHGVVLGQQVEHLLQAEYAK